MITQGTAEQLRLALKTALNSLTDCKNGTGRIPLQYRTHDYAIRKAERALAKAWDEIMVPREKGAS